MKQYIYYWYHHMMPEEDREEIEQAIRGKHFDKFIELYKKYAVLAIKFGSYNEEFETWFPTMFLPDKIAVFNTETEEFEEDEYALSKPAFMKITYEKSECG